MRSSSPPSEKKKNSKKQVKRGEGGRSAVREGTGGGKRACKRGELWGPVHPLPKKNKQTNRHCNSLGVRSRQQHLPDKFEYSHYLFAG